MEGNWIRTEIDYSQDSKKKVLLGFVKPLIEKLKGENLISHFYISFQPYILFEVYPSSPNSKKEIGNLIKKESKIFNNNNKNIITIRVIKEDANQGNKDFYGDIGWEITAKFMEFNSQIYLDILEKGWESTLHNPQNPNHIMRFLHLLLNQLGFNKIEEFQVHNLAAYERGLNIFKKK